MLYRDSQNADMQFRVNDIEYLIETNPDLRKLFRRTAYVYIKKDKAEDQSPPISKRIHELAGDMTNRIKRLLPQPPLPDHVVEKLKRFEEDYEAGRINLEPPTPQEQRKYRKDIDHSIRNMNIFHVRMVTLLDVFRSSKNEITTPKLMDVIRNSLERQAASYTRDWSAAERRIQKMEKRKEKAGSRPVPSNLTSLNL